MHLSRKIAAAGKIFPKLKYNLLGVTKPNKRLKLAKGKLSTDTLYPSLLVGILSKSDIHVYPTGARNASSVGVTVTQFAT